MAVVANTLAYFNTVTFIAVLSFIEQAPISNLLDDILLKVGDLGKLVCFGQQSIIFYSQKRTWLPRFLTAVRMKLKPK